MTLHSSTFIHYKYNWFQVVFVVVCLWWSPTRSHRLPTFEFLSKLLCVGVSLFLCCFSKSMCLVGEPSRSVPPVWTVWDSWPLQSNLRDHWACRPISLHVRPQNEEIHGISAWFVFSDRLVTGQIERQGFTFSVPRPADMCIIFGLL